jgi:Tfp pilus assembly protein PilV
MPLPVRERAGGGVVTHRKSCGESGFTLIQVVLATAVLTIAALSLTVVQISSLSLTASNRETAEARHVARQILEDLRSETVSEVYARYNSDPHRRSRRATAPGRATPSPSPRTAGR